MTAPLTSAAVAVAALKANAAIEMTDIGSASLAGLNGRTVDLRVTEPQTAIVDGEGGTFHLDPGFTPRRLRPLGRHS